jgi:KUP system potassium uptake protein
VTAGEHQPGLKSGAAALTLGALGVVFGDIGTSPLYALHQVFAGPHPLAPTQLRVYGVCSLIFWALMIIVTIKYVSFIMHADNDGEGGIMALITLVNRTPFHTRKAKFALLALGIFGASLFYGDGMITPAISVLSAVEGVGTVNSSLNHWIVPITLVIVVVLFSIQRFGTGAVGALFGPIMIVWFVTIGVLGIWQIRNDTAILRALSPTYAAQFLADDPTEAFFALGSVVLAVTGAEALYADMGHFGRPAIRRAWLVAVLPALMLNYMGQSAWILAHPSDAQSADLIPFYELAPGPLQLPLVILATAATVIASQAVISGAFSVTRQAVQLGYLPRLEIRHTSAREVGQIYVPVVNWGLFIAIIGLILGFRSSSNLASAYGIAVTGTLAIDTILAFVVVRTIWKKPLWLVLLGATGFLIVDLAFFTANLTKIFHGGWFPLLVAALVFTVLMTWRRGREIVTERMRATEMPIDAFVRTVKERQLARVPGTAVFLTASGDGTPRALQHNAEHNHVLHEHVVLLTASTLGVPRVADDQRIAMEDLGYGIVRLRASFGFQEEPRVPRVMELARAAGLDCHPGTTSYFLNHVTLLPGPRGGMAMWRKRLFITITRNAVGAARFFRLPSEKIVELGTMIEL